MHKRRRTFDVGKGMKKGVFRCRVDRHQMPSPSYAFVFRGSPIDSRFGRFDTITTGSIHITIAAAGRITRIHGTLVVVITVDGIRFA